MDFQPLSDAMSSLTGARRTSSGFSRLLERIVCWSLHLSVFLVPLWFLPVTLDVLELNKQTLLVMLTMVGLIAWLGKAIMDKSFTLSRSWLHLVVAFFGAGYLVTSFFSVDKYLSFVGNFGQMQWAFASVAAFIVFYLIAVNAVKDTTRLYHLVLTFLASSVVAGVYGFIQMTGTFLVGGIAPVTSAVAFNTVGTINSLAVFMTIPLVLAASLMVLGCKDEKCVLGRKGKASLAAKVLVWLTLAVSVAVLVVVDFWVSWAAVLFGMALLVGLTVLRTRSIGHSTKIVVPAVLCVLSIGLLIWKTPINLNLPAEVSPSAEHSWRIARQVLQDHPLFGSGPGTWIYDYSQYRAAVVNLSQFWTIRFERGLSTFFTLIAMVGLIGTALWLMLLLSGIAKSALHLLKERNDDMWQAYLTVFAGWATVVFISFFYNYNFAHHFVFWFLFALLASLVARGEYKWDGQQKASSMTVLSVVFIVLSVSAFAVTWLAGQRLVADAQYSASVTSFRSGKPIQESIDSLNSAVALNRLNDSYYRNLSQAYLIRLGQELQNKPDQEKAKLINSLVSAAIDTGKRAAEISPMNVDNWSNLAVIYQSIASFTRGADEFAIKNYEEALKREPNNPVFYNEIGKLYILRADAHRTLLSSNDEKQKKDAEANARVELDKAAEQLNQAIQAKGDYAPAHYNLGILYERQGRVKDAVTKLEQVLSINNKDIGVGFQLGILYYRDGQKDKALSIFEQIVALEPSYANARWFLAALYEEKGRYDDAVAQVQKVQESNQGNETIAQRLQQLIKLRDANGKPKAAPIPEPIKEEIKGPAPLNEVQNTP